MKCFRCLGDQLVVLVFGMALSGAVAANSIVADDSFGTGETYASGHVFPGKGTSFSDDYSFTAAEDLTAVSVALASSGTASNSTVKNLLATWKDSLGQVLGFRQFSSDTGVNLSVDPLVLNMVAGNTYRLFVTGTTASAGGRYTLTVSAVPLPAAAWLFGSALVGFVMVSSRRKV